MNSLNKEVNDKYLRLNKHGLIDIYDVCRYFHVKPVTKITLGQINEFAKILYKKQHEESK